jgi:hypothetical protein
MAVIYITVGGLLVVWTSLWYIWMNRHGTTTDAPYFWCVGFFLSGLGAIIIGLGLGWIGRVARHAEAPADTTASNAAVQAQQPVARVGAAPAPLAPVAAPQPVNAPVGATLAAPGGAVANGAVVRPIAGVPETFQPR